MENQNQHPRLEPEPNIKTEHKPDKDNKTISKDFIKHFLI